MQKKTAKKTGPAKPSEEKIKTTPKAANKLSSTKTMKDKLSSPTAVKANPAKPVKKQPKDTNAKKSAPAAPIKDSNKPGLRAVYSNSKHTLLPLGFATDFKTKKPVVIFSDLATAQVHTVALAVWNRWRLKEVKKINTET